MSTTANRTPIDRWGDPFDANHPQSEVFTELLDQAELLTRKTKGTVIGEARERVIDNTVWIGLWAKVPAMGDYEYKLITVSHPLATHDPTRPFPLQATDHLGKKTQLGNQQDWLEWLEQVLQSPSMRSLIERLMESSTNHSADQPEP
jgi:hypothetical protein